MCYRHETTVEFMACPECGELQQVYAFRCSNCGAELPDIDLPEIPCACMPDGTPCEAGEETDE